MKPPVVGGLEPWIFMTFHISGMSSSQLTFIFFRGVQTTNQTMINGIWYQSFGIYIYIYIWVNGSQWYTHDWCYWNKWFNGCEWWIIWNGIINNFWDMGMDQYLLIPFLGEWTSIYQLFWCSPGVQGFDTLPYEWIWIIWDYIINGILYICIYICFSGPWWWICGDFLQGLKRIVPHIILN